MTMTSREDKSRILLTLKDEISGEIITREVGVMSEFNMNGSDYRDRFIQDWIRTRGNPQNNTKLSLINWAYFRRSVDIKLYGKAGYILDKIQKRVGGSFLTTGNNVPFLEVDGNHVVYFAKRRLLRIFRDHIKIADFKEWPQAVNYILDQRPPLSPADIIRLYKTGSCEQVRSVLIKQDLIGREESVPEAIDRLSDSVGKSDTNTFPTP